MRVEETGHSEAVFKLGDLADKYYVIIQGSVYVMIKKTDKDGIVKKDV
jgi:hypothetical protein